MPTGVFIHPTALVESEDVGAGTRIWAFAHVLRGAVVGRDCSVGDHCFIESGARVGDGVTIKNGNMLWDGVTLEDGVFVGPAAVFTNDLRPRSPRHAPTAARYTTGEWLEPTLVRRGASIGAGAVIMCGHEIGPYAMVAAAAVVTHDVPAHALVVGSPARLAGWVCMCGSRLPEAVSSASCPACGRAYAIEEKGVREAG